MAYDRDTLQRLAENRRRRMPTGGCPRFDLTDAEFARSSATAMRLAKAPTAAPTSRKERWQHER